MAGRFGIWAPNRGKQPARARHGHDIAVAVGALARQWALAVMIAASAAALLATSAPDEKAVYIFKTSSDGPRATLSASKPQSRYLVRARVTALGPEQVDTTQASHATLHGTITANTNATADAGATNGGATNDGATNGGATNGGATNGGATNGASPFVRVSFGSTAQGSDSVSALSSFELARRLTFTGNCAQPNQDTPCQAEIELDLTLAQTSTLPNDESLSIDWTVNFESRAHKSKDAYGEDELVDAPWTIEIVELGNP